MEYEKIKEWLDEHVKHFRNARRINSFNNQISANLKRPSVLMFTGIDIVADVMGLELVESVDYGVSLPYEYSFVYDGVIFVQYEEERINKHVHL